MGGGGLTSRTFYLYKIIIDDKIFSVILYRQTNIFNGVMKYVNCHTPISSLATNTCNEKLFKIIFTSKR